MHVFLDAPQDFANVCLVARTLETLGTKRCYVHDPNHLIRKRYGKSRTRRIQRVSAGAFFRIDFERIGDPTRFLSTFPGRKVAAVARQAATPLTSFEFRPGDLVLFGSEGRGISPELLGCCEEHLTIPQQGVTDSMNLAVSVGIVLYEHLRQSKEYEPLPRRHVATPLSDN